MQKSAHNQEISQIELNNKNHLIRPIMYTLNIILIMYLHMTNNIEIK